MNHRTKRQNKNIITKGFVILLSALTALTSSVCTLAEEKSSDLTDLSLEQLSNIEVVSTATLTETKPRLVPAAVTTITAEQIKASGARSLFELLDIYVPNLQWIRHHWEADHMGLRGIINDRDDKYLLLVNGRIMNERTHFGALSERDLVILTDIHHIDVVRGPGSALYGPGAVSMVINIVTYNAETFQGTETTSRLGAIEEFYSGEVKHGQKFDDNDGGLFVYAGVGKYVGASKYDSPLVFPYTFPDGSYGAGDSYTDAPINRDGADTLGGIPELKWHVQLTRDNWDIWARYTRGGKQFTWAPGLLAPPPGGFSATPVTNNAYAYQQYTGYIGYKQELAKDVDIDYAFSYETTDFASFRQNDFTNAYREEEYYAKAIMQWQPNDNHKLAFGPEISHRELGLQCMGWPTINPVSQRLNPMSHWSTNLYSLLGEWQWNIDEKWTTFLGARLDDHTFTNWMFSPRAAIVHTPDAQNTYKFIWSRSVRANVEEEMKAAYDANGIISKPEILDSIEFRYERRQSSNLDLAASLFLHYNFKLISFDITNHQTSSVGTQKDWGAELEATYHTDKTRLTLSHGYTKLIDFDLEQGKKTYATAAPYGYGDDLANWSNHITKLTAQYKLDDKWTLDASFRIYWGFPGTKDYESYDPYAYGGGGRFIENGWEKSSRGSYFLNLGLQYKPSNDLTIGITGYNLLGIFNPDLNKRNYLDSNGDFRDQAVALGVSVEYKF